MDLKNLGSPSEIANVMMDANYINFLSFYEYAALMRH